MTCPMCSRPGFGDTTAINGDFPHVVMTADALDEIPTKPGARKWKQRDHCGWLIGEYEQGSAVKYTFRRVVLEWSPSAARENVRACICKLVSNGIDDETVAQFRAILKDDRAFDSPESLDAAMIRYARSKT